MIYSKSAVDSSFSNLLLKIAQECQHLSDGLVLTKCLQCVPHSSAQTQTTLCCELANTLISAFLSPHGLIQAAPSFLNRL